MIEIAPCEGSTEIWPPIRARDVSVGVRSESNTGVVAAIRSYTGIVYRKDLRSVAARSWIRGQTNG